MAQVAKYIEFGQITSLFIYLSTFLISLMFVGFYSKYHQKKKCIKIFLALFIITPIIVIQGFRYQVGTDYMNYTRHFYYISKGIYSSLQEFSDEPLFILECRVLFKLFHTHFAFFIFNALVMNILLLYVMDKTKDIDMITAYIVYYLTVFPVFLNIERQGIACLCLWLGFLQLSKQKYIPFFICNLIGSLIHSSAILFFPFGVICFLLYGKGVKRKPITNNEFVNRIIDYSYEKRANKENKVILYIIFVFFSMSPLYLGKMLNMLINLPMFSFFSKYMRNSGNSSSIKIFFWVTMLIVEIVILKYFIKTKKRYSLYCILAMFSCLCCLMDLYIRAGIGTRMLYYSQYGSICMAGLVTNESYRLGNRWTFRFFVLSSCLFYFLFVYYIGGAGDIFPYKIILL